MFRLSKKPFQPKGSEGGIVGKGTIRVPFFLNQQHFNAVKMFRLSKKPFQPKGSEGGIVGKGTIRVPFFLNQ